MPLVILKTNAGMNFQTAKGTISLNGFCVLNNVSDEELRALKSNDSFNTMLKDDFAEVTNSANHEDSNKVASEVINEQAKRQERKTQNVKKEA